MAYQNYPYQQYPYQAQMPQQMTQQVQQPMQMQSGGFISVPTEQDARNYPVAPGNVITFKIENQPIVCEKAQGFSQLEGPVFNKYRLVKEEDHEIINDTPVSNNDLKQELDSLKEEVRSLKERVYSKPKQLPRNDNNNKGGNRE